MRWGTEDFLVDANTNQYLSIDRSNLSYKPGVGLIEDIDDYQYEYDYENRIVEILNDSNSTIGEFAYDALGRRIEKKDLIDSNNTKRYYYDNNWQVPYENISVLL